MNLVLLFFGFFAHSVISSIVRAPFEVSVIDRCIDVSDLSFLGHLHHRQLYVDAKPPTMKRGLCNNDYIIIFSVFL